MKLYPLHSSGSMSHTSSYLITSNPGVDNEEDTPCNFREALQGESCYPTEAATTTHRVLAPVADIIATSDDPVIDHCTNRMNSPPSIRLHQVRKGDGEMNPTTYE